MKSNLMELLNRTNIAHPTRIVAIEISHLQLRIKVSGIQWWRSDVVAEEGQIVFTFEGVGEGLLDTKTLLDMEDDEALEIFKVSLLSEKDWAKAGTLFATYCYEPLPQPLQLFAIIEDYLWSAGAQHSARDYLNMPNDSILRFCDMTGSNSYLVAEAPPKIHEVVLAELKRQSVSHTVISSKRPFNQALLVQIGDTSFTCERAIAEA